MTGDPATHTIIRLREAANDLTPTAKRDDLSALPSFCVIGEQSRGVNVFNRTWFSTQEKAAEHAKSLIRRHQDTQELLIVKVVGRAKRAEPPVEVKWVES